MELVVAVEVPLVEHLSSWMTRNAVVPLASRYSSRLSPLLVSRAMAPI